MKTKQTDPTRATVGALKDKEVVSVGDGRRLGYIGDMTVELATGRIISLSLPGERGCFGLRRMPDRVIPWRAIATVGDDVILVDPAALPPYEENNCK